jgi:hypothetical protein
MPPTLVTLPLESLCSIAEHLPKRSLNSLVWSNRFLYHLLLRSLYEHANAELRFEWPQEAPWIGTARQVKLCLAAGFDPSHVLRLHQKTLLHNGGRWGWDEDFLQVLLDYGADVNARDQDDYTPLHFFFTVREGVPIEPGASVAGWGRRKRRYSLDEEVASLCRLTRSMRGYNTGVGGSWSGPDYA